MEKVHTPSTFQPIAQGCSEYLLLLQSSAGKHAWEAPGIELGYFQAKEMMEPTLIRWITNICSMHAPFVLDDAHSFSESKMRVLSKQLYLIDDFLIANGCPGFYGIEPALPSTLHETVLDKILLVKKRGASEDALFLNSFSLQASSEAA